MASVYGMDKCTYSESNNCIDDPVSKKGNEHFNDFVMGEGYCAGIGSAYIEMEGPGMALPVNYDPMHVREAKEKGLNNNRTAWSLENQKQLKATCPLLYKEIGDQELVCVE